MIKDEALEIHLSERRFWDENKEEFVYTKDGVLLLKHSLISISKWESKWKKPFLDNNEKTNEELRDYIKCMSIGNADEMWFDCLTKEHISEISDYIKDSMTATWFSSNPSQKPSRKETLTSELIYYYMLSYGIPMECQKWHLNRLMTLIKIFSIKNTPPKKMSKQEAFSRQAALNAQRRAKMNSRG